MIGRELSNISCSSFTFTLECPCVSWKGNNTFDNSLPCIASITFSLQLGSHIDIVLQSIYTKPSNAFLIFVFSTENHIFRIPHKTFEYTIFHILFTHKHTPHPHTHIRTDFNYFLLILLYLNFSDSF